MHIKKLQDKERITDKFAVTSVEKRQTKEGKPYLQVELSHPTGTIAGKVWHDVLEDANLAAGQVYELCGTVNNYKQKMELIINQADKLDETLENYLYQKPTLVFDIELFKPKVVKKQKGESNENQNYIFKLFIRCYFNISC